MKAPRIYHPFGRVHFSAKYRVHLDYSLKKFLYLFTRPHVATSEDLWTCLQNKANCNAINSESNGRKAKELTKQIPPSSTVLAEKLTGPQSVKNSKHFMEPEGSLPRSQQPATRPYPEPEQFQTIPPTQFFNIIFNIILSSTPRSSKHFLSLGFPHINHVYNLPLPHTCYRHLPPNSS